MRANDRRLEPEPVEVIPPFPPPPEMPTERSKVAWLLYLIAQHLIWLLAAVRSRPKHEVN